VAIMMRWMGTVLVVVGLSAAGLAGRAGAQQGSFGRPPSNPLGTPVLSPYLGLNLANPAVGLYGVVRPQQQLQNSLMQVQQEQSLLEQATLGGGLQPGQAGQYVTGHRSYFLNFSHYFPPSVAGVNASKK
jgi:hypothetical protein